MSKTITTTPTDSTPAAGPTLPPLAGLSLGNNHFAEMVRRAMPLARHLVCAGVGDFDPCFPWHTDVQTLDGRLKHLTGHHGMADDELIQTAEAEDQAFHRVEEWSEAAYVLGIAVGLLISKDAILAGGAQ